MDMQVIDVAAGTIREVTVDGRPVAEPIPAIWDDETAPWYRRPAVLDRIEQALIAVLWVWLVQRAYASYAAGQNLFAPILPVSESAVMLFVLIRRPTQAISLDLGAWLLAVTATAAPLLIQPGHPGLAALAVPGMVLLGAGQIVQLGAKLSLRRSFGIAPANRGIKADGLYRFVRHPMYAGYLLTHVAIMLLMPSLVNLGIYALGWVAQILRLRAEEALLGGDPAYAAYAARVRWRLIPGVF